MKNEKIKEEMFKRWREEVQLNQPKQSRLRRWIILLIRIALFPVFLVIRLFRWTYHYED